MERYQDKKVVIIGGTSGMGLATAKMLLDGGARVLVTGRSKEGLESAQKELGNDAIVVSSDARSLTDIEDLASKVKAEFDTFDLLFVNAGFSIGASRKPHRDCLRRDVQPERQRAGFRGAEARAADKPGWLCRPHDLDRQRQGNARSARIWSCQGSAAIIRPDARRRADSSRDSCQRGDARPHRHADPRQSVSR